MDYKVGDKVVLVTVPKGIDGMPLETKRAFELCLNRAYDISDITEEGLIVLDVSKDVDPILGGRFNDLRVEEYCVRRAADS